MSFGEKVSHTGKHSQETYSGTYVFVYGMMHGHDGYMHMAVPNVVLHTELNRSEERRVGKV